MNADTSNSCRLLSRPCVFPLLMVVLFAGAASEHMHAQAYKISKINPPGAIASYSTGINKNNIVVGNFIDSQAHTVGFGYLGGSTYKTFKAPGSNGTFTRVNGINDSNTAVGDFFGNDNFFHGYLLKNGKTFIQYDIASGVSTSLFGINNLGNFVGATGSGGPNQGFVNIGGNVSLFYGAGNDNTFALAINNLNQVVGQYYDDASNSHGYYRDASGAITEIIFPGALQTACTGISDSGEIVGWYVDTAGLTHGFTDIGGNFQASSLYQILGMNNKGTLVGYYFGAGANGSQAFGFLAIPTPLNLTTLQIPRAQSTSIYGVNNANNYTGQYTDSQGNTHGMLVVGNQVTPFDDPNAAPGQTYGQGVNASKVVVGYYLDAQNFGHGFQYNNGTFTEIGPPGNIESWAENINDAGQIAGTFIDSNNLQHAFVLKNGNYTQLDVPNTNGTSYGWGINNAGTVTVSATDAFGYEEAYIYKGGKYANINVPGVAQSFGHSINKNNAVVLTCIDYNGAYHGALLNGTSFYLFDDPKGTDLRGDGLNDNGVFVGRFLPTGSSLYQGFKGSF